jgi:hypothetical protein
VVLPLSHEDSGGNWISRLTPALALDRTFVDRVTLVYTFAFTKFRTGESTRSTDRPPSAADPESLRYVEGDADRVHLVVACADMADACGETGGSIAYALRHRFAIAVRIAERLWARVALSLTKYTKDVPGNPAGRRRSETWTLGDLRLGYDVWRGLSLVLGAATEQPASDSRGNVRFPFFDFETPQNNYTLLYLSLWARW